MSAFDPSALLDLPWRDGAALLLFAALWAGYEPLLRRVSRERGAINRDMDVVRAGWMAAMLRRRESRLLDANLMGHALNSASFFASANLILIAALAGALFGGEATLRGVRSLDVLPDAPVWLFQLKVATILLTLARGLLDFIWAIRQMNFWLAAVGAAPEEAEPEVAGRWAEALGAIVSPALTNFSAGVRAYYFALAAGVWLLGPAPFAAASLTAVALLVWRQSRSKAALGVRRVRELLDEAPPSR
ncbi:MAG: DUF599 family protein [Pseudomonadota bacterium]|nr:DUF599 family protein [Pseudomonadota bacterium]